MSKIQENIQNKKKFLAAAIQKEYRNFTGQIISQQSAHGKIPLLSHFEKNNLPLKTVIFEKNV